MKLCNFIDEEKSRLDSFHRWYLKNHNLNPHTFPYEMETGDWDEQLSLFNAEEVLNGETI